MSITFNTSSTDELFRASTHTFNGRSMLAFNDKYGVARITLHGVPVEVAQATAAAFNEAMEAHEEPTHDPDFAYPRPETIDYGEDA